MATKKRREKLPIPHYLGLLGLVVFVVGFTGFIHGMTAAENEKSAAGIEACTECHEDVATAFKTGPHFVGKAACIDCHGDPAKHIETGGEKGTILAFKDKNTALQNTKQCLACHQDTCVQYMSGPHGKASMSCTDCHGIHKTGHNRALLQAPAGKLCAGCHQDVMAQFNLNERHRLKEGILECTTCHDPHKPAARERLGGLKQQECLKCHTDKAGPFIFEHEASAIEGCSSCHEVHGSPNRHLLKFQSVGELCFSCHAAAPSWHRGLKSADANCASCHSAVHGSNLDPLFLK